MDYHVIVLSAEEIGRDTHRVVVERPAGYPVRPGQAADVAIDEDGWWDKPRPFHFRRTDDPDCLEFVLRTYGEADPVARRMARLKRGDSVVISDAWVNEVPHVFFGGWRRPQVTAARMPDQARAA